MNVTLDLADCYTVKSFANNQSQLISVVFFFLL